MQTTRTEKKPVSFRMRTRIHNQLIDYCSSTGMPKTRTIERAVDDYVMSHDFNMEKPEKSEYRAKRVDITVRMRIDINGRLEDYCKRSKIKKTLIVERAVEEYINAYLSQQGILKERYTIVKNRLKKEQVNEERLQQLTFNPADKHFK